MGDAPHRRHRFRTRLTAAFVLVAALSSATLALVTYGATSGYRWRNFEQMTTDEVRLALALAPSRLDEDSFQRLLSAYEKRSGTDAAAVGADGSFYSSSITLTVADLPPAALAGPQDELVTTVIDRDSSRFLVVGGDGPDGARYVFLFSLEQLESSLAELRIVLVAAWLGVVIAAAAAGNLVARRTLRPVREAGDAATALASGLLDTRLPSSGADEFGAWAESFNTMAEALESKIDELDQAARRERRFTSDVAHDLRTPLTGMAVRASLLLDELDELPPDTRTAVAALAGDVNRLKDLVLELLELARLDSRSERTQPESFAVSAAIYTTVEMLDLDADTAVTIAIEPALTVCAERAPFRRIVANIVSNAETHGRGPIEISATRDAQTVLIAVRDHGPGIDVAQQEQIFDRFFKSDESRALGGSGLGLSIAREHARSLGGDVTVTSAPGAGACFTIVLPAGSADQAPLLADQTGSDPGQVAPGRQNAAPHDSLASP